MTLGQLLERPVVTQEEIEERLNGLSDAERVREITALTRKQQERLWEVAGTAGRPIDLDFLVPEGAPPLDPRPFEGKNSLPAFTRFRKVFYRTPDGEVAGYNNQSLEKIIGPGYFVVEPSPGAPGGVVVNYLRVPSEKPAGWPEIRPNEAGLSRLVYSGMKDYLRYVSPHVAIGRAFGARSDAIIPMSNWFVLCRPGP